MSDTPSFDPNISRLKRAAKELKRAVETGDAAALSRLAEAKVDPSTPFALRSAQQVVAREHGFDRWHDLIEEAGERLVDERDLHRWLGVNLNNAGWKLLGDVDDVSGWPQHEKEAALYRAIASAYHWMQVGTPIHQGRAEHLISRTAALVGLADEALSHAVRYQQIIDSHPDLAEDWDVAFAAEAHARALAASGRTDEARAARVTADELCARVADPEDREVVERELDRGPWFGVN